MLATFRHEGIAKCVYKKFRKKANPDCNLVYNKNQFFGKKNKQKKQNQNRSNGILVEPINYCACQGQAE